MPRANGQATYSFVKSLRLAKTAILGHSTLPLRAIFVVGAATAFLSLCFGAWQIYLKLVHPEAMVPGYTDIIVAITFLSGTILIALGIIGWYIELIMQEVRGRPTYVISEVFGHARENDR